MTREPLPPRRDGVTMDLIHALADGNHTSFTVTFGFDERRQVREVFCLSRKSGTDLQSLLHQACIAISVGLQHGATMEELRQTLGEENDELAPQSVIGLIVRAGATLDCERLSADIHKFPNSPVAQPEERDPAVRNGGVEVAGSSPAGAAISPEAIEEAVANAIPLSDELQVAAAADGAPAELIAAIAEPTPLETVGKLIEARAPDDFEIPAFLRREQRPRQIVDMTGIVEPR